MRATAAGLERHRWNVDLEWSSPTGPFFWVPLTDATDSDGCPQVVPGVHRMGTLAHRDVGPLGVPCADRQFPVVRSGRPVQP